MRIVIEVDDQKAGQGVPGGAPVVVGTALGAPGLVGGAAGAGPSAAPLGAETVLDGVIVMNAGPAPDDLAAPATGGGGEAATIGSGTEGSQSAGAAPDSS